MGKVSYANMKLKVKNEIKTFNFQDNKIEVIQYLPIEDKYSLIMSTLAKSEEHGIYNPLKIDMYFNLHIVYSYTNISFTEKQKENEEKIYDMLFNNGIIDNIINLIPEEEYSSLLRFMEEIIDADMKYHTTAASVISRLIDDLPANAQSAMNIVDNFDKTKFEEVIKFAQAVNNNKIS